MTGFLVQQELTVYSTGTSANASAIRRAVGGLEYFEQNQLFLSLELGVFFGGGMFSVVARACGR